MEGDGPLQLANGVTAGALPSYCCTRADSWVGSSTDAQNKCSFTVYRVHLFRVKGTNFIPTHLKCTIFHLCIKRFAVSFLFGLTNSFITLRSKNVIKKDFPMCTAGNSLKVGKKNHNYCLNDLTIFSTGS